jgi:hypothetical protein
MDRVDLLVTGDAELLAVERPNLVVRSARQLLDLLRD